MSDGNDTKAEENGNGKGRRITIKLDGSMITALVALLTAGGLGIYNTTGGIGEMELRDMRDGATIQINEAYKKSAERSRKLAIAMKRHRREMAEVYETIDWMALAMAEMGKKHPATWRKIKRTAPDYVTDMMEELGNLDTFDDPPVEVLMDSRSPPPSRAPASATTGGAADFSPESSDESVDGLLDEVNAEPEPIDFPDIKQIRSLQRATP